MSGMACSVLVRSAFSASDSGIVSRMLRDMADNLTETRKGRHWDCEFRGTIVSVGVESTEEHRCKYEELLLEHDLQCDDAPEAFLVSCGIRDVQVREWIAELARRLAHQFDGINCGFGD